MEQLVTSFKTYLLTEKHVAKNTVFAYMTDMQQYVNFLHDQGITLVASSVSNIKEFLAYVKKQGVSAQTLSRKVSTLKAFFAYATTFHGTKNHAQHLVFPKLEKRLPRALSEEDIAALLEVACQDDSMTGQRNKLMINLLYSTGMRISELVGVRMQDIHLDTALVSVYGKGGRERMVPIPHEMVELLQDYCKKLQHIHPENKYLFTSVYGGRLRAMTRQACWLIIKKLWQKTGIQKNISPHMLRHSLATHMLKNGVNLRSLQVLLGHEQLNTVQIYTHVETSYLRSVYDKKHPRS